MNDLLLASLRFRLGFDRLSEVRDSVSKRKALFDALPASYYEWADTYAGLPPRLPGTLRPVVARLTGLNPFDDAATAAQMLLTCHWALGAGGLNRSVQVISISVGYR